MAVTAVTFDRVRHMVRLPVELAGEQYRFLLDTGIGVTVVSTTVAKRHGLRPADRTFTGRRMSGQEITAPLVGLPDLRVGGYTARDQLGCVADLGDLGGPDGFAGIIGPGLFEPCAITTDPATMTLTVHQPGDTPTKGYPVPLDLHRDDPALSAFAVLVLPNGREVRVEVDTGSHNLILDSRFMADCGVKPDDPGTTTTTGTDETGYQWTRRWATISGGVHLAAAPQTRQRRPLVHFQDIIYDGLVGTDYLDRYRITFDIERSQMLLDDTAPPWTTSASP